jgi:hypothetical protein
MIPDLRAGLLRQATARHVWFSCPVSCPLCRLLRRPADVRRVLRTLRKKQKKQTARQQCAIASYSMAPLMAATLWYTIIAHTRTHAHTRTRTRTHARKHNALNAVQLGSTDTHNNATTSHHTISVHLLVVCQDAVATCSLRRIMHVSDQRHAHGMMLSLHGS